MLITTTHGVSWRGRRDGRLPVLMSEDLGDRERPAVEIRPRESVCLETREPPRR